MKILMLTASLDSGGAETHILELSRALTKHSHKVFVASSGGKIAEQLKKDCIPHINIPLHSKKPHHLLSSFLALRALIEKHEFDIVHAHSRISAFLARLALGKRRAPLLVSTVHARFRSGFFKKRLSFWGRSSIAVSEDLRDFLSSVYSVPYDNITVIPNAIDTEIFSAKEKEKTSRPPKIIFASRLDTDCSLGASLLCRIAPRLTKKYPKISIEIAGGGKAHKKLSSLAAKTNSALGYECIRLLGHVNDMPKALRSADIFVGVSRAALEAMSVGLPVVLCGNEGFVGLLDASNISIAESTNFCCRGSELPTSISLYDSLSAALDMSAPDRHALGKYLREYVCRHHGLDSLATTTEDFYKSALNLSPADRGDIVLCGYYGFGNLGDDALLACAIEKLKTSYPLKRISVICHSPKRIEARFGVRAVRRENIRAVLREIAAAEKLVLGGGSILQNSSSMRSLHFYCALIRFAAKKGVRVELISNGLGPLRGKRAKKLVAKALYHCQSLSFRDKNSANLALSLGCDKKNILVEDDLSSRLSPCPAARIERLARKIGILEKSFVLVGIKGKSQREERKEIEAALRQKSTEALPVFVVMHPKEDTKISKKMAKRTDGIVLKGISPSELLALAERAELAIGNRYHLLYLAHRAETPILPFGDDPKIVSLKEKGG